jgi:hypothetical protein
VKETRDERTSESVGPIPEGVVKWKLASQDSKITGSRFSTILKIVIPSITSVAVALAGN